MLQNFHFRLKCSIVAPVLICAGVLLPLLFLTGCGSGSPKPISNNNSNNTTGTAAGNSFLQISDIHFNPFYDPDLALQLIKTDASQWEPLFIKSTVKGFGKTGKDETNYPLLVSTLQSMAKTGEKSDFVIFTGDFLAHDLDTQFKTYAKAEDEYSSFVKKTISFLALMLSKYLPGLRVYFCLGNTDSDTGDYQIVPEGTFLKNNAPFQHCLRPTRNYGQFVICGF